MRLKRIVSPDRLIDRHGTPFSAELDLDLTRNTPSVLFRWLCAALLMSARISHDAAMKAARALTDAGWTTAEHMAEASWEERVEVLNTSGYARFDESTARMLGETARLLLEDYDGDLRKLRAASDRDPDREREALKACKGIGDVGADIFFRDLQTVCPSTIPSWTKPRGALRGGCSCPTRPRRWPNGWAAPASCRW